MDEILRKVNTSALMGQKPIAISRVNTLKKLNYIFIKSIACTFYRFTSVITHLECWDNKRKDCSYPFPLFVIYKVSKTNLKNHRTSSVWENKNFDHGYFNRRIRWKFNTDQKKEIMINWLRN